MRLKVDKVNKYYDRMMFDTSLHQPGLYSQPAVTASTSVPGLTIRPAGTALIRLHGILGLGHQC